MLPGELSVVNIAGYQGNVSLLTKALGQLADNLQSSPARWDIVFTPDITVRGQTAASLFEDINTGSQHIGYVASSYLTVKVPALSVLDIPFSVTDRAVALKALDSEAGAMLIAETEQKTDYKVLGFWDNGFRHISNAVRPIRNLQDCKGLVIRTLDSSGYRAMFNAMGFTARTTDVKDMVGVIERGEVQAQENPLANFVGFSIWRYHRHISLTSHCFGVLLLVCNRTWYDSLTTEKQKAVQNAAQKATGLQRQLAAVEDAESLLKIQMRGITVIQPEEMDIEGMKNAIFHTTSSQQAHLPDALVDAYLGAPPST
jgi:TRAP-type transport system periplasmic protein